uniref:Glycosyl transferase family 2 n=1 Tax=Chlorobium phaeobacteroides (strain BS1) TaxID=331678 RepID=B3ENW1_CHLPB
MIVNNEMPSVEIIIPHYRGIEMLERCLNSLAETSYPAMSICIVDNASGEKEAISGLKGTFEALRVVSLPSNRGYAGGCNSALFSSTSTYVVFLNDDTVVDPSWLSCLVNAAEEDGGISALQPKILSLPAQRSGKKVFDYAGGAGGLIDRLGYPYCYGRTGAHTEQDNGQYDRAGDIFWASGVALFARRDCVTNLGGFDEDFFMHMEEIDLCWRMRLQGQRIVSVPSAVVYHEGGASLAEGSAEKIYLNHRNNMVMLLKNRSSAALFIVFPLRLLLECAAAVLYLSTGRQRIQRAISVFHALFDNLRCLPDIFRKRRAVQAMRRVADPVIFRDAPVSIVLGNMTSFRNAQRRTA